MSVPVLLVTGFLGAGKTTFINTLLHAADGKKIAAIVNDFGSINIDAALLEAESDGVIGLKNGCICCSLQGDLLRTLRTVLDGDTPDLIVIEASGVADPQGIVQGLMDPILWDAARLDTIVCLVDAQDMQATPARWQDDLWRAQVTSADIVQLSKTDGVGEDDLNGLISRLGGLGKTVFDAGEPGRSVLSLIGTGPETPRATGRTSIDATRFATLEWRSDAPVSLTAFQRLMGALSPDLVRAKGFLTFTEKPGQTYLFQLVGQRASLAPHARPPDGCELVLIGERGSLDPDAARARLDTLTV
ncbi:CobW family GTP-binding protein [Chachezhania antarctica]|uniref:CobW family GTP-binding protein n=1 Tax=Chachezhania antarctica TaxID=2340860 RepID=UPI000EAEA105|nr:GTP-binding protein [Chachezhania antarctica]|tara:strand:+ start:3823 stop:4728 length:906 start_codon:yes stop_codon:yes gene_type:complete